MSDLFKDIGIGRLNEIEKVHKTDGKFLKSEQKGVIMPSTTVPQDLYTASSSRQSQQAMMLRMEHLFDDVEIRVCDTYLKQGSGIVSLLTSKDNDVMGTKGITQSKPTVMGDTIPVPFYCPPVVEQLLEAALAHHNLGSFPESLKFLEAARIQLEDVVGHATKDKKKSIQKYDEDLIFDVEMYILICKGNVYQSCGDDEQSILHYMEGWAKAKAKTAKDGDNQSNNSGDNDPTNTIESKEWEMVCVNSIGMLAFYNLRYEVAALCFSSVVEFREMVSV